jgi:hypothetical protein
MPPALMPGASRGRLSYTVTAANGARLEVLLKGQAFKVKAPGPAGTVAVGKHVPWWGSPAEAFAWLLRNGLDWPSSD